MPETRDTYQEWLASLKPGDRVYIRDNRSFEIVKRRTATQIILNNGSRWTAATGIQHPLSRVWNKTLSNPVDCEREILLKRLKESVLYRATTDQLREVAKILGIEVL